MLVYICQEADTKIGLDLQEIYWEREHPVSEVRHQREERARGVTDPQCTSKKGLARPLGSPVAKSKSGCVPLRLERARVSPPTELTPGWEQSAEGMT